MLESSEVGLPLPGRGDVLVQVGAASVHPGAYFVMTGEPYVVRLAFRLRRPRHGIPGRDLAGVAAAVGKDVTALRPGDEVFGQSTAGTLAESARVPADNLSSVPANLSVVDTPAVPTSAMAALQALRKIANVRPGQTALVTATSGGVGSFAVQIAKAFGADVAGVCSTRNVDESSRRPPLRRGRPHPRKGRRHRLTTGPTRTTQPRAYVGPNLPPLRRTDRSSRKKNR